MLQPQYKKNWLAFYLLALTSLFILLEISFFIQASDEYLGAFKIVAYHLKIPASVFPGVAYFLSMQLLIHLAYAFFIWSVASFSGITLRFSQAQIEKTGIVLWILGIATLLLVNQYFYPDSKFAILTQSIFPPPLDKILLIILIAIFSITIFLALYGLLHNRRRFLIGSALLMLVFLTTVKRYHASSNTSAATAAKPNIIIIGIDAVRPDFLGYFGNSKETPELDAFLNQATVFSEALTPLARTYPAWVSILTGQYPKKNGARFDLAQHIQFNLHETLPAILQRNGYQTIYATDETRFSNIDQRFGFDQLMTPPSGFNDFLLGGFNDFPLSNLLVNTAPGRYLFPYSYGNRAAYITYEPTTFLNLMQPALAASHTKPLFLAVHFCLPHYPYIWAGRLSNTSPLHNYQQALHQADQQVYGLLQRLKKNHLLEHSVVILLSDHGEALELPGDRVTEPDLFIPGIDKHIPRFYPPSMAEEAVNQSAGHGTDVLGLTQYHTVLAFRFFGIKSQNAHIISGRVSLLDIKPTLLNLLNLPDKYHDGKSLLSSIVGKQLIIAPQPDFFIETDFTPVAVRSVNPETRKVLFEGIDYIQIDPLTTRLSIRQSMVNLILSSKQYADFYGPWVLALYPQDKRWMMPVLVNLESGKWTTDLRTAFARQAPAQHMLQALKKFYRDDITQIKNINH